MSFGYIMKYNEIISLTNTLEYDMKLRPCFHQELQALNQLKYINSLIGSRLMPTNLQ